MQPKYFVRRFWAVASLAVLFALPTMALAEEKIQEWEVLNPAGTISIKSIKLASRLTSLDSKTIVLRWNGKHNGDNYLNRIAELFAERIPSAKVIKVYEADKSTIKISGSNQESARIAKVIQDLRPDIVIGSQAD